MAQAYVKQIEELDIGESNVRLERLPIKDADEDAVKDTMARIRNSQNQIANRLRKSGKGDYRVESVSMLSPDRTNILCMAVTTRVEDDDVGI